MVKLRNTWAGRNKQKATNRGGNRGLGQPEGAESDSGVTIFCNLELSAVSQGGGQQLQPHANRLCPAPSVSC
eukprot:1148698-Pelagomonas_calceolata.AAC.2